ncbi:MAG: HK97 family phage prohead protease [Clostridia bacterium]|jgi:hypothetical protein|nr:HK97 family phage prohead protease [Clostridia bacterium]
MRLEWKEIKLEAKAEQDGVQGAFRGLLSTYGNVDLVGDMCVKGCFQECLQNKTIYPTLWQHMQCEPIGHMNVTDSDEGLEVDGVFNQEVQRGREAWALLKAGDIGGLSIGYVPDEFEYDKNGIRRLLKVTLWEGSFVTFPANPEAYAEAKNMDEKGHQIRKSIGAYLTSLSEEERKTAIKEFTSQIKVCSGKPRKADDEMVDEEEPVDNTEEDPEDLEDDTEEDSKSIIDDMNKQMKKMKEIR